MPRGILSMKSHCYTPEQRFWGYADPKPSTGPCWGWLGATNRDGYAVINVHGRTVGAHRYSFYLRHGRWPRGEVLHSCHNRSCTNPDHLREGTRSENMCDRWQHHRDQNLEILKLKLEILKLENERLRYMTEAIRAFNDEVDAAGGTEEWIRKLELQQEQSSVCVV